MKDVLLIVHFESGDEIHLTVLDIIHLETIQNIISEPNFRNQIQYANNLIELIYDNKIEDIMCQSYVTMDYFTNKYNIKNIIHLPEVGM